MATMTYEEFYFKGGWEKLSKEEFKELENLDYLLSNYPDDSWIDDFCGDSCEPSPYDMQFHAKISLEDKEVFAIVTEFSSGYKDISYYNCQQSLDYNWDMIHIYAFLNAIETENLEYFEVSFEDLMEEILYTIHKHQSNNYKSFKHFQKKN